MVNEPRPVKAVAKVVVFVEALVIVSATLGAIASVPPLKVTPLAELRSKVKFSFSVLAAEVDTV
ncbi:hypothetical protein D3C85_993040 [compost metagenome]